MGPRRRVGWFARLSGVVKPETVGAGLIVLTMWGESRVHSNHVEAAAAEDHHVDVARIIHLERIVDTLTVDNRYLKRQVRALRFGHKRRHAVGEDLEPYGPRFEPEQRGTLLASIGHAFRRLFFLGN